MVLDWTQEPTPSDENCVTYLAAARKSWMAIPVRIVTFRGLWLFC